METQCSLVTHVAHQQTSSVKSSYGHGCAIRLSTQSEGYEVLSRMYTKRGYVPPPKSCVRRTSATLIVEQHDSVVGTVAANWDASRLSCAVDYPDVVSDLQARKRRICEFGRFAIDPSVRSRWVLGALFHSVVLLATHRAHATDFMIEVNPRHVGFYLRGLELTLVGGPRHCPRVDAPAVLLHGDLADIAEKIHHYTQPGVGKQADNFYRYFLSPDEQMLAIRRLAQF